MSLVKLQKQMIKWKKSILFTLISKPNLDFFFPQFTGLIFL